MKIYGKLQKNVFSWEKCKVKSISSAVSFAFIVRAERERNNNGMDKQNAVNSSLKLNNGALLIHNHQH
jgi:hypothetical protein